MPVRSGVDAARSGDGTPQFIIEQRRAIWRHLKEPKTDHQLAELLQRPLTQIHATLQALRESGLVRIADGHDGHRRYRRAGGKPPPELRRSGFSARQRQVLDFLARPRTRQGITDRFRFKPAAATKLLADLRAAGAIVKTAVPGGRPRDFYSRRDVPVDLGTLFQHRPGTARDILRLLRTPLAPVQISQSLGVSHQRIHKPLETLLAAGLVRRVPVPGRKRSLFLRSDAARTMPLSADQQDLLAHLGEPRTAVALAHRAGATLARTTSLLNGLTATGHVQSALPAGMQRLRCYWRAGLAIDAHTIQAPLNAKQAQLLKLLGKPRSIRWLARRCRADPITTQHRLARLCKTGYAVRVALEGSQLPRVFYCRAGLAIDRRKLQAVRRHQRLLALLRKPCSIVALSQALHVAQPTITADLDQLMATGAVERLTRRQGPKPALYRRAGSRTRARAPVLSKRRRQLLRQLRQPRLLADLSDRTAIGARKLNYELAYLCWHRLARKLRLGGNAHAVAFCRPGVSLTPKLRQQLRRRWSALWIESLSKGMRRSWRRRRRQQRTPLLHAVPQAVRSGRS